MRTKRLQLSKRHSTKIHSFHIKNRVGAAVVEFAVISPLMIMMTVGLMEVGRLVMVKQIVVNASREGARQATLPDSSAAEIVASVNQNLTNSSIKGAIVSVDPVDLKATAAGTPVTVTIDVGSASISWLPKPMFALHKSISASTTMRKESL